MRKLIITITCFLFIVKGFSQYKSKSELFKEGKNYFKEGKLSLAEKKFKELIKIDSSDTNSFFNLGAIYLEKNERENAIFNFLKCIESGDEESYKILKEKFSYDDFKINSIISENILHKIGLDFFKQNKLKKAEDYFLKAAKLGNIKSSEILITEYKHKAIDVTFYNIEDLDSSPLYIHKGKQYDLSKVNKKKAKKFSDKLENLVSKNEIMKNIIFRNNSKILINISSKGKINPIFQNISEKGMLLITELLVNNFNYIPGTLNGENVNVISYGDLFNQ